MVNPGVPCGYFFVREARPISDQDRRLLRVGRRFSLRGTLNIVRYVVLGIGKPKGAKPEPKGDRARSQPQFLASVPPKE